VNVRVVVVAIVVAALAAWAWNAYDTPAVAPQAGVGSVSAPAGGTSGVFNGAAATPPIATKSNGSVSGGPLVPVKLTLAGELAVARNYRELYDRLANTSEGQTPEGQYVLYRILRACANVTDRRGRPPSRPVSEEQRETYINTIADRDPAREKRLAAFEAINEDKCVGVAGVVTTEAELAQRLANAAAAGSPAAKALQVEQEMWAGRRANASTVRGGPTLNDGQIEALRTSLASKDPEALLSAGRILANNFRDISIRIGPDQMPVESRALTNALQLAACDFGYPCGDNNSRILNGCAFHGHCEAGNLRDYLAYYAASPHDAMLQDQYRQVIRNAIATGDWSALSFVRGPVPNFPRRTFGN